ncbi:MAG TPA: hypothetical protein VJN22_03930 [Candidatus Eremiobacteraceae bacterium]|nr:hypothetical protein [Candidatus Eremiobacteraceae bacterium]
MKRRTLALVLGAAVIPLASFSMLGAFDDYYGVCLLASGIFAFLAPLLWATSRPTKSFTDDVTTVFFVMAFCVMWLVQLVVETATSSYGGILNHYRLITFAIEVAITIVAGSAAVWWQNRDSKGAK